MQSFDLFIQNYFYLNHSAGITQFMYIVTGLFDPSLSVAFLIFFSSLLVYLVKGKRFSLLFLFSIILGLASVYVFKQFFDISRPLGGVITAFGQSFPSGHATLATIYFVMIMYIFRHQFKGVWQLILNIFCVAGILVVAFSRVYLGVHWTSDVLAGMFLGLLISYISIKIFKKQTL